MPRIYSRIYAETADFAAATAGERVDVFGASSTVLTQGRLPDGVFGRLYCVSVSPRQEGATTLAVMEDVYTFCQEASFELLVGNRKCGGGPVKFFPAGGADLMMDAAGAVACIGQNGKEPVRLVAEVPIGALDQVKIEATGPTTVLSAILTVEFALHCILEEKGKGEV